MLRRCYALAVRLFVIFCTCSVYQLSVMRSEARRLRSACEKKATREWKERKHQLNKTILSKLRVGGIFHCLNSSLLFN